MHRRERADPRPRRTVSSVVPARLWSGLLSRVKPDEAAAPALRASPRSSDDPTWGSRPCSIGWWGTSWPSSRRGRRPRATGSRASGICPGLRSCSWTPPACTRRGASSGNSCAPRSSARCPTSTSSASWSTPARPGGPRTRARARPCEVAGCPCLCLLNKIDRVEPKSRLLPLIDVWRRVHSFREILPISAVDGTNCDRLLELIATSAARAPGPLSRRTRPATSRRRSTWPR